MGDSGNTSSVNGVDHVGIYVADLDAACRFYSVVLGCTVSPVESFPDHGIRLARVRVGAAELELIEGPVERTMLRHTDNPRPGAYHVGLEVDDIEVALQRARDAGRVLLDETPRADRDLRVAFLAPRSAGGVLVELIQKSRP